MRVSSKLVTLKKTDVTDLGDGTLWTEASTLGLKPGQFPSLIVVIDEERADDNLFGLPRCVYSSDEPELFEMMYCTMDRKRFLHVCND